MRPRRDLAKVGFTVAVALVVLAAVVLLVGEQTFLFTKTTSYYVQFRNVGGLAEGNPVQLNGVNVGRVDRIVLPEDTEAELLLVWVDVEQRYSARVREDSVARIKSLGLLGDKYVELTSGSAQFAEIPPNQEIPADQPTDVDALIATGEGVVDSVVATAQSLSSILQRIESGEGVIGELLVERDEGRLTDSVARTLSSVESIAKKIEEGEGTVGRLLFDRELGQQVASSVERIDRILTDVEEGEGALPALLNDPATKQRVDSILSQAEATVASLEDVSSDLKEGDGILPRLLNDQELADGITEQIDELLRTLNDLTGKVQTGEGTAAKLINDPAIYEALNDVVIGINESRLLRWLIRNRQKAGIEKRYRDAEGPRPPPID